MMVTRLFGQSAALDTTLDAASDIAAADPPRNQHRRVTPAPSPSFLIVGLPCISDGSRQRVQSYGEIILIAIFCRGATMIAALIVARKNYFGFYCRCASITRSLLVLRLKAGDRARRFFFERAAPPIAFNI